MLIISEAYGGVWTTKPWVGWKCASCGEPVVALVQPYYHADYYLCEKHMIMLLEQLKGRDDAKLVV